MKRLLNHYLLLALFVLASGCKKGSDPKPVPPAPTALVLNSARIDNVTASSAAMNYNIRPTVNIALKFNNKIDRSSTGAGITVMENGNTNVPVNFNYQQGDSAVIITSSAPLKYLTRYIVQASTALKSAQGGTLNATGSWELQTQIDSSRKFSLISDDALLDLVQSQTFKYFWDFGHPVSGLARERNTSGDLVTSGGSGFGIMAIVTAVDRRFITRAQGLQRLRTITTFLKNTAQTFHGAFPHWLNGVTGAVIPFSTKDNGADLVETSFLVQGLLTARQYFSLADADEQTLRADINTICNRVEWDWFRNGGQNVLYWHWSPDYNWDMNLPIRGWNECLITYVLGASSPTHPINASVYAGWKAGGNFLNGNTYFGFPLPLGPAQGGPLFFSHYSFMGIKPANLTDANANYLTQTTNHAKINYTYCRSNPRDYYGYSDSVWGLTASDIKNGYTASSPTNDKGFIAPTAAIASLPFTPAESMAALKFYYYVLGDKLWKSYGFVDAFSLHDLWFADSFLAIDQGPIIVMIENHRSGLLWNLFTSCPEVKTGMRTLGFSAPYL